MSMLKFIYNIAFKKDYQRLKFFDKIKQIRDQKAQIGSLFGKIALWAPDVCKIRRGRNVLHAVVEITHVGAIMVRKTSRMCRIKILKA